MSGDGFPTRNPYAAPQSQSPPPLPRAGNGQYAPCPKCGGTAAKPAGFTWWGGVLGPKLLSHVTCGHCSAGYNGKSGRSNDKAIAIYVGVSFAIALVIGLAVVAMQVM
ncbi:MAG: hypothetical protein AB7O62_13535 [Pirellulales bacterium]